MSHRICFVLPRIGSQIAGGAEGLCRELAERLAARGDSVTAFATCAVDNRSWENSLPTGKTLENGVVIERFPVDNRDLEKWIPIQIALHQGKNLSIEEELIWLSESVNSRAMYQAIESRQDEFDYFIFAPYLFGTTISGPHIVPHKSLLLPCLHDESYAYLKIVAAAFHTARGCLFNARGERELAERLYGRVSGWVVGMGFEPQEPAGAAILQSGSSPYILYLGRKETGKNTHILLDYFVQGKESGEIPAALNLLVVGPGDFSDIERPNYAGRADIIDVGRVSEAEKQAVIRHSLALVQPSGNESFSIVLMEAWLQHRPVLVNAYCDVTREHVLDSNGGLFFGSAVEFSACVRELYENENIARQMGEYGWRYVQEVYRWQSVLERFDTALRNIEDEQATSSNAN